MHTASAVIHRHMQSNKKSESLPTRILGWGWTKRGSAFFFLRSLVENKCSFCGPFNATFLALMCFMLLILPFEIAPKHKGCDVPYEENMCVR